MKQIYDLVEGRALIAQGGVIAYPTEAMYGLGCDAFNEQSCRKILDLKQRSLSKGLIILIAKWSQLPPLIEYIPKEAMDKVKSTWPGPVTWVFPASSSIPFWLTGGKKTIAIRMSSHPIAQQLCETVPIVSTSANLSNQQPMRDINSLIMEFPQGIDAVIVGPLGQRSEPSAIFDVLSQKQLR